MANIVVEQAEYLGKRAQFGPVSTFDYTAVTLAAQTTVPTYASTYTLPCNLKVIAVSAIAVAASGNQLGINLSSGRTFGTLGTGTITFTGTATGAGTCTVSITGPSSFTQTITFAIGGTNTPTQSGAALVAAIVALNNPQIYAVNAAGVVTIYQLTNQGITTAIGTPQQYAATLSGVLTQTVGPNVATNFSAGTGTQALPDNSFNGNFPPRAAVAGSYLFPTFQNVPVSANGTNTVFYPPLISQVGGAPGGIQPYSEACWDIIMPCTRELTLVTIYPGEAASTTLYVTVLGMPIILNPTQPYNTPWTPNNTTIGAPSTD